MENKFIPTSFEEYPEDAGEGEGGDNEVTTFPNLVYKEFLCALIVIILFILLSVFFIAPLEDMADPSMTPNPSKAPWYFVGLQELMVYFDPWVAGVMIPLLILIGLMLIPYLDTNPEGKGEYTFRKRKLAVIIFTVGLVLWFVLIVIGQYLRGPDWRLYWPWEAWGTAEKHFEKSWNFPLYGGIIFLCLYFGLGIYLSAKLWREFRQRLGGVRYFIFMVMLLFMAGVVIKIVLRLTLNVKYILATPWFNI